MDRSWFQLYRAELSLRPLEEEKMLGGTGRAEPGLAVIVPFEREAPGGISHCQSVCDHRNQKLTAIGGAD